MNQDKTKPKGGPAPRPPAPRPPSPPAAPGGAPPVQTPPPKIEINPILLSPSLARDLERIPQAEWHRIESVPWRVIFTRDMAEGIRFVDAVAFVVNQQGGLFIAQNLERRRELEEHSQQILDAFRALIGVSVQVARKLALTSLFEKHWRFLSTYGPRPKKAEGAKDRQKNDAAKQGGNPTEAA